MSNTIEYYNLHAQEFVDSSVNADMSEHYEKFLKHIPVGGTILDLGCGSGRDTKHFLSKGYEVTAVDGSIELCKIASAYTGINVQHLLFEDLDYDNTFNGVWACASLLHVPKLELSAVFKKIAKALKKGGYLYVSFKYGTEEREKDGRVFTDFTPVLLHSVIDQQSCWQTIDEWITSDVRPGRESEKWLNLIIRNR